MANFYHIVLIPTRNRPHLMRKLLDSIVQNTSIYKYPRENLKVIVIDDSTENRLIEGNANACGEVRGQSGLNVVYYGKDQQNNFIADLERYFPNLQSFIWDTRTSRRGFGGIRNLCLLIGLYEAPENTLFTFLDDDVTLANLVSEMGRVKIKHVFSYFEKIDDVFSSRVTGPVAGASGNRTDWVNFAGGGYTRDMYETPWIVVHLLWVLGYFFEVALKQPPTHHSRDVLDMAIFRFPKGWDCVTYQLSDIRTDISLERLLRVLAASSSIMKDYASYRFVPTIYNPKTPLFKEWNPYSTGGNVTFRKHAIENGSPYPVGGWRGEDITWAETMQKFVSGGAQISVPVGHFRTAAGKRKIEEEFGKDLIFDLHLNTIRYLIHGLRSRGAISSALSRRFDLTELGEGREFPYTWYMRGGNLHFNFDQWPKYVQDVRNKMASNGWFRDQKHANSLKKINAFLDYVEDPKFVERIKFHIPPVDALFEATQKFGRLIAEWPKLMDALRQKKETDFSVTEETRTLGNQQMGATAAEGGGTSFRFGFSGAARDRTARTATTADTTTISSLLYDIRLFVDFADHAFEQLTAIEEHLDDLEDSREKEEWIRQHDEILAGIDREIAGLEGRLRTVIRVLRSQ